MNNDLDVEEKSLCYQCVSDLYLSSEIKKHGITTKCSYCRCKRRSYTLEHLGNRIEEAFDQHFECTPDQPSSEQYCAQFDDPESSYYWERDGESLAFLLEDMGGIPYDAAHDVQILLDRRYYDYDTDFEEHMFSKNAQYVMKIEEDERWENDWQEFERIVKTESRFFSQKVNDYLTRVFDGIEKFTSRFNQPLKCEAGPGKSLNGLYRARVFQSEEEMLSALERPDQQLGTPDPKFAKAGRMNPSGVAVFYGATQPNLAIAEVRPPVGSRVVVAYFELTRPVRLLDLTALQSARAEGSIFDPTYAPSRQKALFLRQLAYKTAQPAMPSMQDNDYLTTQAIADFLGESPAHGYDGVIFPSTQSKDEGNNVVLFHRTAMVQNITLPEGSKVMVTSRVYEPADDREYESYQVTVLEPGKPLDLKTEIHLNYTSHGYVPATSTPLKDTREATLKIRENDLKIYRLTHMEFSTAPLSYSRSSGDLDKRRSMLDNLTDD